MRKIRNIRDIVEWGLCVGCGACLYACKSKAVEIQNFERSGIRPIINERQCIKCSECLSYCPGMLVHSSTESGDTERLSDDSISIGPFYSIYGGYSSDGKIRHRASSGGALTSLALYCLEKKEMNFVLHTGVNPHKLWENLTVKSRTKNELMKNAGSRYLTSSPCTELRAIELSDRPCVFIGRPCDVAAVSILRKQRPDLNKNLGLVLSFFCAGTPSALGTKKLLEKLDIDKEQITELHYRGYGWPGNFAVKDKEGQHVNLMTYEKSWGFLNKYRPFRCHICPDGLGELSDISCGDYWAKYNKNDCLDDGQSILLARSSRGNEILQQAIADGYIKAKKIPSSEVIKSQGLISRRLNLFGRLLAMRLLLIPTTNIDGFYLFKGWQTLSFKDQIKSIVGTIKRLILRGYWRKGVSKNQ